MTKLYKLTSKDGKTFNNTQWGEGVSHEASGKGELCSGGWLHAYTSPLLAMLLNPIHAAFEEPLLWEAEGEIEKSDHGLKIGTSRLTTIKQIPLPQITRNAIVRFAILCAKEVCKDSAWHIWADNWLSGKDRSASAASAAVYAAVAAANAANAAHAAANAAHAAADAANAAAYAAYAANAAAYAAAFDLHKIAELAIKQDAEEAK